MSEQLLLTVGGDEVHCSELVSVKGVTQLSGYYTVSTVILFFYTHLALDASGIIWSDCGLSVLLRDTSTCRVAEPGIKPPRHDIKHKVTVDSLENHLIKLKY